MADSEYLQNLIDKIHILKKELILENEKLGSPIDVTTVFTLQGYENVHLRCRNEYEKLKLEYESYKSIHSQESSSSVENELISARSDITRLQQELSALKESVEAYRLMLEEEKQEKLDSLKLCEEVRIPLLIKLFIKTV